MKEGRVPAALLLSSVGAFVTGYLIAITADGVSYSWSRHMVSELGAVGCRMAPGGWICSPCHAVFNAALVCCGGFVTAACALMAGRWGLLLTTSTAVLGVALVVLGLFPPDAHPSMHMVAAVLALPIPSLGLLLSAVHPATPWLDQLRGLRGLLGATSLTLCLAHVAPGVVSLPRGMAETFSIAALLGFLTAEAARCLWSPLTPAGPAVAG